VWESVEVVIEEATDGPDGRVLLQVAETFRGGASGVQTDVRAWEVLWIADGRVARRALAWSKEEGQAAAGLPDGSFSPGRRLRRRWRASGPAAAACGTS
jgi:hypothetical protein